MKKYISVDKDTKEKYLDVLRFDKNSPLHGVQLTDLYFISAALGYKNKRSEKTSKKSDVRLTIELNDKQQTIFSVIAYSHKKDFEILLEKNDKEMFQIIEEYANGGASLLYELVTQKREDKLNYESNFFQELRKIS